MTTGNNNTAQTASSMQSLIKLTPSQRVQLLQDLQDYEAAQNTVTELDATIANQQAVKIRPLEGRIADLLRQREAKYASVLQLQAGIERAKQALVESSNNNSTKKTKPKPMLADNNDIPTGEMTVEEKVARLNRNLTTGSIPTLSRKNRRLETAMHNDSGEERFQTNNPS